MIKCKDCKAFSPQSEHGGVCNFTNFGTVKNDDGCHAGAIINDIYNSGRADAIDDVLNLDRYKFGVTMLTAEEYIKVSDLKQLKEQIE